MIMRIIIYIVIFFLANMVNAAANGEDDLDYQVNVTPITGPNQTEIVIAVKNNEEFPLDFEFPTSQLFEMIITDKGGNEVYVYSKGRYFLQAFQTITVQPHDDLKRVVKWNYQFEGKRLPEGEYTIYTTLKPININNKPIKNRSKLSSKQKIYIPGVEESFRDVKVSGTKGNYLVRGEIKHQNAELYYVVEDGHIEYIKENKVQLGKKDQEWVPFKIDIHIPQEKLPHNASLLMYFYEKNNEGKKVHTYPFVLERLE
ncbi:BsuPI-related putative proteinase inhibitor [Neobacillus kokaensis]|uniref:Intracellular proteinase inhibitor BsuPI domain-containing protein n=1 Tax=Neobacillus kokaensis TaxID=2759023 RepID=A0ABQ3N1F0_9BACI|nr:BsuPI-related putative proteinase inhibitor [Neobacillus kokaensis]GHH98507.1 hypothetical protein AM1BK_20500 [Neobacillus kokaensis]